VEEIKVTIDEHGNVKISVFGIPGPLCLKATEEIERLLGGQVEREYTSEFYRDVREAESLRVKNKA
jgi:hypothetical protein